MTMDDYVDQIELQLGAPIVNVEISAFLPKVVNMAFLELRNYITDVETVTLPYRECIDVSNLKIANIVYIMRSNNANGISDLQNYLYAYSYRTYGYSSTTSMISYYADSLLREQVKNTIATDMDFHFDKTNKKVYIHANQITPTYVTLVYTPEYESVENIKEPFWQNLLSRLSLARAKEMLARVRGKYTLNSATYNLDADQLMSEAQSELSEIRNYLNSNADLLLPID